MLMNIWVVSLFFFFLLFSKSFYEHMYKSFCMNFNFYFFWVNA